MKFLEKEWIIVAQVLKEALKKIKSVDFFLSFKMALNAFW